MQRLRRDPKPTAKMTAYLQNHRRALERKLEIEKMEIESRLLELELEKTRLELEGVVNSRSESVPDSGFQWTPVPDQAPTATRR